MNNNIKNTLFTSYNAIRLTAYLAIFQRGINSNTITVTVVSEPFHH